MKEKQTITLLTLLIVLLSGIAAAVGIFSDAGPGEFEYKTIRGATVVIYGKGLYKHMSADVAVQGIAQDVVTLFLGVPLLLVALLGYRKEAIKSRFLLTGVTGYFFVTYLFYTAMGMYNELFLVYVTLLGLTFFALYNLLASFDSEKVLTYFPIKTPVKFVGGFLIFNSVVITLMWLGHIIPPLLDGTIYPAELHHYTTMIVQGFDLGLLLPVSFVAGLLLIKRKPVGIIAGVPYIIFLSILMTALTAKIVAMGITGVEVFPAVVIIPLFNLITIYCTVLMLKNISI